MNQFKRHPDDIPSCVSGRPLLRENLHVEHAAKGSPDLRCWRRCECMSTYQSPAIIVVDEQVCCGICGKVYHTELSDPKEGTPKDEVNK